MTSYSELEDIELRTPTEIAKIDEIRVPVVKAMAYIKFAVKESNYEDSVDITSAMATDATHELIEVETAEEYKLQAILSLENAIEAAHKHGHMSYKDRLLEIKDILEK